MSRSGMHEALEMPSLTFAGAAGYLGTLRKPSPLITFAAKLQTAIAGYRSGTISAPSFERELRRIGVDEQRVAELLSVPVYRAEAKSDECDRCKGLGYYLDHPMDSWEACDQCEAGPAWLASLNETTPPEPRDASGRVYCPDCLEYDGDHQDWCIW